MQSVVEWKNCDDPRDIVHNVVQALVEGRLVILPLDSGYHLLASGLSDDATKKLQQCEDKNSPANSGRAPLLCLRSTQEVLDFVPDISPVAARCVRRGWPGPIGIELKTSSSQSLISSLPIRTQKLLQDDNGFSAIGVAAHELISQAMRLLPGPLVALPICSAAGKTASSVEEAASSVAELATFVVDDGPFPSEASSTRIRVDDNSCSLVCNGGIAQDRLSQLSEFGILIVCTGNTCRSPMAEVIFHNVLAEKFPEIAASRPPAYRIASAGLSAFPGGAASSEAVSVMSQRGLDLSDHQSRSVTEHALYYADLVLTMTNSHRHAILDRFPNFADKVHLVSGSESDVSDPFGGSESVYAVCADQIEGFLRSWAARIDESWFPHWQVD